MKIVEINNGITAPKGFLSSGIHCGVKEGYSKKDSFVLKKLFSYIEFLFITILYTPLISYYKF